MTVSDGGAALTGGDEPERIAAAYVYASFFPVLGVKPALGRAFLPEENQAGRDGVVILSHGLWQRRFGADPNMIGKTLTMSGTPVTVVGIMPPGLRFPEQTEVWRPLVIHGDDPR